MTVRRTPFWSSTIIPRSGSRRGRCWWLTSGGGGRCCRRLLRGWLSCLGRVVDAERGATADDECVSAVQVGHEVVGAGRGRQHALLDQLVHGFLEDALFGPVHPSWLRAGLVGAGAPVPASAAGAAVNPVPFQSASAGGADQQPGQLVAADAAVGGGAGGGDVLGGQEVDIADQRRWASSWEIAQSDFGFQARVGLWLVRLSPGTVSWWSLRCRFHTCRPV